MSNKNYPGNESFTIISELENDFGSLFISNYTPSFPGYSHFNYGNLSKYCTSAQRFLLN